MKIRLRDCLKVALSVFLLYLGIRYWGNVAGTLSSLVSAAVPLVIGGVVAYLVNIVMSAYERWYFPNTKSSAVAASRRPVCLMLAFLTLVAIVVLE